jgi:hypothetical protein
VTESESSELTEAEFDDHMACEGVTSPHDPPPFNGNGREVLETEEEDGEMITPQRMFDTTFPGIKMLCILSAFCASNHRQVFQKFQTSFD